MAIIYATSKHRPLHLLVYTVMLDRTNQVQPLVYAIFGSLPMGAAFIDSHGPDQLFF